jgi:hypothetical protein
MRTAVALIVVGGLIILGVVASAGISHERDKERVAEFYRKNSNAAVLPSGLRPEMISPAELFGFAAGGVMVLVGIWRSRSAAVLRAEPPA